MPKKLKIKKIEEGTGKMELAPIPKPEMKVGKITRIKKKIKPVEARYKGKTYKAKGGKLRIKKKKSGY